MYTIQRTLGIKSKLYSIYQDGVEWVRSLSLAKAKKIVDALLAPTIQLTQYEESNNETTTHENSNRPDDTFGREQSTNPNDSETSILSQEENRPVSIPDGAVEEVTKHINGCELQKTTGADAGVCKSASIAEFQKLVRGIGEIQKSQRRAFEKQHEIILDQHRIVLDQHRIVLDTAETGYRLGAIAQAAIDAGRKLCNLLEVSGSGNSGDFGHYQRQYELEMQTIDVQVDNI